MSNYLSATELATMVGCLPNSRACMRRWLMKHSWPFEVTSTGFPIVSRVYHDARMSGASSAIAQAEEIIEPDFSFAS